MAIDISHWRRVHWEEVPEEIKVVFIKATEGDYMVDPSLESHIEGALGVGKIVGLYHFYRTKIGGRVVNPGGQAAFFLKHTKKYWGRVKLRANDFENPFYFSNGTPYNPRLGTEINDLKKFHVKISNSAWEAFDLIYTNRGSWGHFKMENGKNNWQGPKWMVEENLIDGLWVAHWGVDKPGRLPRPFKDYWMHQYTSSHFMPGIYNDKGQPVGVDANIIPKPLEDIIEELGVKIEEPEISNPFEDAYNRGWNERTEDMISHLNTTKKAVR
jgi:hypothetical protein